MDCAVMHGLREYEARQSEEDAREDFIIARAKEAARADVTGLALAELVSCLPASKWEEIAKAIRDDESALAGFLLDREAINALFPAAKREVAKKVRQDRHGHFYAEGDEP